MHKLVLLNVSPTCFMTQLYINKVLNAYYLEGTAMVELNVVYSLHACNNQSVRSSVPVRWLAGGYGLEIGLLQAPCVPSLRVNC